LKNRVTCRPQIATSLGIVHRARDAMPPATTSKQTSTARRSVDASRPSSSAAAKARSTETADGTRLSVQQQCFLQALLARGIMDSGDAESLYRCVVSARERIGARRGAARASSSRE